MTSNQCFKNNNRDSNIWAYASVQDEVNQLEITRLVMPTNRPNQYSILTMDDQGGGLPYPLSDNAGATLISSVNILPTGDVTNVNSIDLTTNAANPGATNTLWVNSADANKLYYGATEVGGGGGGDVSGGNTSLVNSIPRYTDTTGKVIKDSSTYLVDDVTFSGLRLTKGPLPLAETGNTNICFGFNVGGMLSTGTQNTLIGSNIATNSSSFGPSSSNTCLGGSAFQNAQNSCYNNTAIGHQSLQNINAGTDNTAIGRESGYNATTNQGCIYIGTERGVAAENLTLRIANFVPLLKAYIQGIHQASPAGTKEMVVIDENNQLGSQPIPGPGDVIYNGAPTTLTNSIPKYSDTSGTLIKESSTYLIDDVTIAGTRLTRGTLPINESGDSNTVFGYEVLRMVSTGSDNTMFGSNIASQFVSFNPSSNNCAFGSNAMAAAQNDCFGNTAIGGLTLRDLNGGAGNIALGYGSGINATTNNSCIYIGSVGFSGEDDVIRIGDGRTAAYIAGIHQVVPSGTKEMVVIDENNQLGSQAIPTGGSGDVVGPATANNNRIAVFDGTSGKLLKNSAVSINAGNVSSVSISTDTIQESTLGNGIVLNGVNTAETAANNTRLIGVDGSNKITRYVIPMCSLFFSDFVSPKTEIFNFVTNYQEYNPLGLSFQTNNSNKCAGLSGRLYWTGNYNAIVRAHANFSMYSVNTEQQIGISFWKNSVLIPGGESIENFTGNNKYQTVTVSLLIDMAPNDYISIWLRNLSSLSNLIIGSSNFMFTSN